MKVRRRYVTTRRYPRRKAKGYDKAKLLTVISGLIFVALIVSIPTAALLFAWVGRDLPNPDRLTQRQLELATEIVDRHGKSLYRVYANQNRTLVPLEEIPEILKEATVSIEDKNFYTHPGFSLKGIMRALFQVVFRRHIQGGSTLTQQLIKNTLLSPERTLRRKIKELILAIQVERRYSKGEIIQMYLNEVPYGGSYWGVGVAAQGYFHKEVRELGLAESAILAGLPQSPTTYSPCGTHPEAYKQRALQVLRRMHEDGYIDSPAEEEAKQQIEANLIDKSACESPGIQAPHFVMFVKDLLVEQFGASLVETGGLKVTTTLDLELQQDAEQIVAEEIADLEDAGVSNGAAIITDPDTGEILAMVGSKDYFVKDYPGKFNVVLAQRQPGSAMKPVIYAEAFEKGYTPASVLLDVPSEFPTNDPTNPLYRPVNYDGKHRGPVQIRFTLGNSINIPAVKTAARVGLKDIMRKGYEMGATTWEPTEENMKKVGWSLPLGGREIRLYDLAVVFGTFANAGRRQDLVSLLKVESSSGEVLFQHRHLPGRQVLDAGIAFLITHILIDNEARREVFGPNSYLNVDGQPIAVKTGTTDEKRDNWTVGYTAEFVVGVWVGNNDNSPMDPIIASGTTGASPIWHRLTRRMLEDRAAPWPTPPENVKAFEIDALTGANKSEYTQQTRAEYFLVGTEPREESVVQKVKFSKNQPDKLANKIEIARGEYEEKIRYVFMEEDPVSTDGRNRWQEGIDAWADSLGDERFQVPHETSDAHLSGGESVFVSIKQPGDKTRIEGEVEIKARVVAANEIVGVFFEIDGSEKKAVTGEPYSFIYDFSDAEKGNHTIRVRARDSLGNEAASEVKIAVGQDYQEDQEAGDAEEPGS